MRAPLLHVVLVLLASACALADGTRNDDEIDRWKLEPAEAIWPVRAFEDALGGTGVILELPGHPDQYASGSVGRPGQTADAREHAALLLDRLDADAARPEADAVAGEGFNSVVFARRGGGAPDDGSRTLLFASLRPTEGAALAIERTWMALEPAHTDRIRGLAVVLPGTFGFPRELYEAWSDDLRSRGWTVLRLLSQPSRFTEYVPIDVAEGQAVAQGRRVAQIADQRAAETAYAVQAAARFAEGLYPELAGTPRQIVGFSGGAILLPTVVAREPERYESAVIVAGGANTAAISIDSTFVERYIRSVDYEFLGADPAAQRAELEEAYLRASTLDPYHAAAAMRGTRVLIVDGTKDKAVPFRDSTLLWERLGRPDRRSYPTNHVTLFLALPEWMDEINGWLEGEPLALPNVGGP
ncbi:MAG: prolyl oligopeptidase family serine peptidase [Planctomycetota bacterium]